MKVLGICGSHRKGANYEALNWIKEEHPEINFKLIMLIDVDLGVCMGCYSCILNGEETCPLKDDRNKIIDELMAADIVIFASPVYVNQISSIMKKLIERIGYMGHRPLFRNKYAMVMSICKAFGAKESNKYMTEVFSTFGFNIVSKLELKVPLKSELEKVNNKKKTLLAFDRVLHAKRKGLDSPPTLMNLIMFYMFKEVSSVFKESFKADYEYYKDLEEYPYEGSISLIKKFIAKRVVRKYKQELKSVGN